MRKPNTPETKPSAATPIGENFWTQTRRIGDLETGRLRQGINAAEVVCVGPRYVTLHLEFAEETLPALIVPLEAVGACRYRKMFSLIGDVQRAYLDVSPPGEAGDVVSIELKPIGWTETAMAGVGAMARHMARPSTLFAKVRQVLAGGTNLVFSDSGGGGREPKEDNYANWRQAFEGAREVQRLREAMQGQFGSRLIEVLAIIGDWQFGRDSLDRTLASLGVSTLVRVHVLTLGPDDPRHNLQDTDRLGGGIASWSHAGSSVDGPTVIDALVHEFQTRSFDLVLVIDRPGAFHEMAASSLALELRLRQNVKAVYGDHDSIDSDGTRKRPVFKPEWSPDYQAAADYVGQPAAFRADASLARDLPEILNIHRLRQALVHAAAGKGASERVRLIGHVPRILFHELDTRAAADRNTQAESQCTAGKTVEPARSPVQSSSGSVIGRPAQSQGQGPGPRITAIIPTKDNPTMLLQACRSVHAAAGVTSDIVVVDNGATSNEQRDMLNHLATIEGVAVAPAPGPFNFSRLINLGRSRARSEILLLLNDDVEARDNNWLQTLVHHASRPGVGAVGAFLFYPDGRIQHGGVVLGYNGGAGHALRFVEERTAATTPRGGFVREVSAVTAACLAVRADRFDEVGGFDETLPVTLNDVDFCLRLRQAGYRNLIVPEAKLIHRESTSRGLDATPDKLRRLLRETAIFRSRWGDQALIDPYQSPHFSPCHEDYRPREL